MRAIGLRVSPSEVFYIVYEQQNDNFKIITKGKINEPAAYTYPQVLTYYRDHLSSIFKEYGIAKCGIKVAEPLSSRNGRSDGVKKRMYTEGVIIELVNSKGIKMIYGPFKTFATLLGIRKASEYLEPTDFCNISDWNKLNKNLKEASLAGLGVLK